MSRYFICCCLALTFTLPAAHAQADWRDQLKALSETLTDSGGIGLSEQEVSDGLKETLRVATDRSIQQLNREGGFLSDPGVHIPMPRSLRKADRVLRKIGQAKVADKFILTMNRAAEQAVGQSVKILAATIKAMSIADAVEIFRGGDDAATRYFRRQSEAQLSAAFRPIVAGATQKNGVTKAYKKMAKKSSLLTRVVEPEALDLDGYITQKSLDGLFKVLAKEEGRIRQDPAARSSEILRELFSTK